MNLVDSAVYTLGVPMSCRSVTVDRLLATRHVRQQLRFRLIVLVLKEIVKIISLWDLVCYSVCKESCSK
jgi:hypothetical protein